MRGWEAVEAVEEVVLLDEAGRAVGAAPKATVHHRQTPLHLAFSCFVFDRDGRLLVPRRADSKRSSPGGWTNTVCGHPGPGEAMVDAVVRRTRQELGLELGGVRLVLPAFRYRAEAADGTVENEMCPVFVAWAAGPTTIDPVEVAEIAWTDWATFAADVVGRRREVSVWCAQEVWELTRLGPDPRWWPEADPGQLPPAAVGQP